MYWNDTQEAFRSLHTQLKNKIARDKAEIKRCLDLEAQMIRTLIDMETICEGCKTGLASLKGYIAEISEMAPWGTQEEGENSTDARLEQAKWCGKRYRI